MGYKLEGRLLEVCNCGVLCPCWIGEEPYRGPGGKPTRLVESIFTTIPGSPAYVAKASSFKMDSPELELNVNIKGHNAIQGYFRFEAQ